MDLKLLLNRRYLMFAGGGLILLLLAYVLFVPAALPVESAAVERGPFQEILTEDGTTRVREKFLLLAPVSGVLQRLKVHAGDRVQRGQTVALIDWDARRSVSAPVSGNVLRVHREDAGPIERGMAILEIGDPASLEVVVDLLTADAVRVKPGTPVRISRWGGRQVLEGTVRRIEPSAVTKLSSLGVEEQRVNALVDITSPPELWENLGDNFRVECTLILSNAEDVLKIPSGALFREGDHWAVFRIENGRARKLSVQPAGRNAVEVALQSSAEDDAGLNAGDVVIVYPGSEIEDGVRVREL